MSNGGRAISPATIDLLVCPKAPPIERNTSRDMKEVFLCHWNRLSPIA